LKSHRPALEVLAQQLLKQETVSGSVVKEALRNGPAQAPPPAAPTLQSYAKA
jgi:hypothetical protein